jgi:hypothetical protein
MTITIKWDMKNEKYLNQMPHTTPCFPRKNRGHKFHKSKKKPEEIIMLTA